ncbi:Cloroperoxidase [Xylariaceae sp. FL0804]|nr:Cloroperoxidase [Xylariaceae sp. FL0804]
MHTTMKHVLLLTAMGIGSVSAGDYDWHPQVPGFDVRAPCPGLNTLANHGYLPRTGKDIDKDTLIQGLMDGVSLDLEFATALWDMAITTNPTPNATTFSLDDIAQHNLLEHDGSLSRSDWNVGDNDNFNQSIFDETRSYFTGPVIDLATAARAKLARVATSKATNAKFTASENWGTTAAYLLAFGNKTTGIARTDMVEYFFENQRLPIELGWTKPTQPVTLEDEMSLIDRLGAFDDTTMATYRDLSFIH